MNRKITLALFVNAGTEALQTQSRTVSPRTKKLWTTLNHPIYRATFNNILGLWYHYSDHQTKPVASAKLWRLDQSVKEFRDLEVFAADCSKSVDFKDYGNQARWFWTKKDEVEFKVEEQKEWHEELRAKIPSVTKDPEDRFKDVRKNLESAKKCNLLVKARLTAKLFEVTGKSLKAIIEDDNLGSQVVRRWDGDVRGDHYRYCTWANVLRLSFGVSCGFSMYKEISAQCDQEIPLKDSCRDDWTLASAMQDRHRPFDWNNQYMPFAFHVLRKAQGAAGMLIQYDTWAPQVAIWDMNEVTLSDKVRLN